jgi:hypothetical protein
MTFAGCAFRTGLPVCALVVGFPAAAFAQYGQTPSGQYGQTTPAQYGSGTQGGAYGTPGSTYGAPSGQSPSIQAGGLAPPAPMAEDPESKQTEEQLQTADQRDSGRGLEWVYLNAEAGFMHLGLDTFHANNLINSNIGNTVQNGPLFGAGLGVRLVFVTLGARFRYATFSNFNLWTLGGELGLRIPLGNLEPYFTLGGGYASLGSFSDSAVSDVVSVHGFDVRGGAGLDYYVTPVFSIGASITGEILALSRPGLSPADLGKISGTANAQGAQANILSADGSSVGAALSVTGVLGLHF